MHVAIQFIMPAVAVLTSEPKQSAERERIRLHPTRCIPAAKSADNVEPGNFRTFMAAQASKRTSDFGGGRELGNVGDDGDGPAVEVPD